MQETKINLRTLKENILKLWIDTSSDIPRVGKKITFSDKLKSEHKLDENINKILDALEQLISSNNENMVMKKNLIKVFSEYFMSSCEGDVKEMETIEVFINQFSVLTEEFMRASREFDENISMEDIVQALRNVWAMGLFQWITFEKVTLTKSLFAYSMLYPYTDNYLDDPNISTEQKKNFNKGVARKLKGYSETTSSKKVRQVFKLIELIEEEFPRETYTELYEVMSAMQEAQERSLTQHGDVKIDERELLDISVQKGGLSVLLHGYLVKGKVSLEEASFLYSFGVVLQICDDIQDVIEDMNNNHNTIVTKVGYKWNLDYITNNLMNFSYKMFTYIKENDKNKNIWMWNLIETKVLNMIFFAICRNRKLYSKDYVKSICSYFPYRIIYIRTINFKMNRRIRKIKRKVGKKSIEELILI